MSLNVGFCLTDALETQMRTRMKEGFSRTEVCKMALREFFLKDKGGELGKKSK